MHTAHSWPLPPVAIITPFPSPHPPHPHRCTILFLQSFALAINLHLTFKVSIHFPGCCMKQTRETFYVGIWEGDIETRVLPRPGTLRAGRKGLFHEAVNFSWFLIPCLVDGHLPPPLLLLILASFLFSFPLSDVSKFSPFYKVTSPLDYNSP